MGRYSIPLSKCTSGDNVEVIEIAVEGVLRRRLLDLGFVKGAKVDVLQKSPLGDPVAYRVKGTIIALRQEESSKIFVTKCEEKRNDHI
ncbi:FeoA family protein [Calidifontibacillus erzurumensis]|uniref:Ferrous iron transport protein A n=1 Tax=Calidifontibacillus erzurumensis TaxID=2741433 RepID=A0A8J8KC13_9BACI|nr:FeoA family protein [Calidifontibacillus erzurumensis]NSL51593.1 ferrous iron transport protein A [Calidifontibacillus erzurumensis]